MIGLRLEVIVATRTRIRLRLSIVRLTTLVPNLASPTLMFISYNCRWTLLGGMTGDEPEVTILVLFLDKTDGLLVGWLIICLFVALLVH